MDENADCIAVGGIWVSTVDVSFEEFWVLLFDVLRGDDDFDLRS